MLNSSDEHRSRSSREIYSWTKGRTESRIPHHSFHHSRFSTLHECVFEQIRRKKTFTYCRDHSNRQVQLDWRIHCSRNTMDFHGDGQFIGFVRYPSCQSLLSMYLEGLLLFASYFLHPLPTRLDYRLPILWPKNSVSIDLVLYVHLTAERKEHRSSRLIQSITHNWITHFGYGSIVKTIVIFDEIHLPFSVGLCIDLLITQRAWTARTGFVACICRISYSSWITRSDEGFDLSRDRISTVANEYNRSVAGDHWERHLGPVGFVHWHHERFANNHRD